MKIKTNELTGAALDSVVLQLDAENPSCGFYSTDWADGGPIIEREKIDVFWQSHQYSWVGSMSRGSNKIGFRHLQYGPTPLIAAMRCYVASQLGDEVDVPDSVF